MQYTCKNCGSKWDSHCNLCATCYKCGRPMNEYITIVGKGSDIPLKFETRDFWIGEMRYYEGQVFINDEPYYMFDNDRVFIDKEDNLFILGGYKDGAYSHYYGEPTT